MSGSEVELKQNQSLRNLDPYELRKDFPLLVQDLHALFSAQASLLMARVEAAGVPNIT